MNRTSVVLLAVLTAGGGAGCREDGDGTFSSPTESNAPVTPTQKPNGNETPEPDNPATLNFVVLSTDGRPIEGVEIRVASQEAVMTDELGRVVVGGVRSEGGVLVEAQKDGYSLGLKRVETSPQVEQTLRLVLQPGGVFDSFPGTQGYRYDDFNTGLRIQISPNSLQNELGQAWGGEIQVYHALHDLTGEGLYSAPGQFLEEDLNGNFKTLAAYGALSLRVSDVDGNSLQLSPGATAFVELPFEPQADIGVGATVPLWFFHEETGGYRADASSSVVPATLLADRRSIKADISTLGPLLAARPAIVSELGGDITLREGGALAGAELTIAGGYPATMLSAWSDENGQYCMKVPTGEAVEVNALHDDHGVLFNKELSATPSGCAGANIEVNLDSGCISGTIRGPDGEPDEGIWVWTDAATIAATDALGDFCVQGPVDRAVAVRTPDFSDRSVLPGAQESCPVSEGDSECSAHLEFQPPIVGWTYRLSELALAPPSQGLDIDGDGSPDNGLAEAVQIAYSGILEYIRTFLDSLVEKGIISQERADEIYAGVVLTLEEFDETVGLNPLAALIERGALLWIMDAKIDGNQGDLSIYDAQYDGFGFARGKELISLSGSATEAGWISAGPGDFLFEFSTEGSKLPNDQTISFRIYDFLTEFRVDENALDPGMLGGAMAITELVNIADQLIPSEISIEGTSVNYPIPKDEILQAIEEILLESSDIQLSDGTEGISMAIQFAGEPFESVTCDDGFWANEIQLPADDVGFDLDGDGDIDNGTSSLFRTLAIAGEQALYEALLADDRVPELLAEQIAEAFGATLAEVLSIESVNDNLQRSLDDFTRVPLLTLSGSEPTQISLYDGEFTGGGYGAGYLNWTLSGEMEAGRLSASDDFLIREFSSSSPLNGDLVQGNLTFYLPRIDVSVYPGGLSEGLLSYAIPVEEVMVLVNLLLEQMRQYPVLGEDFGVEFEESFAQAMVQGADLYLGDDVGYAYTIVYALEAPEACLTKLPTETAP